MIKTALLYEMIQIIVHNSDNIPSKKFSLADEPTWGERRVTKLVTDVHISHNITRKLHLGSTYMLVHMVIPVILHKIFMECHVKLAVMCSFSY